MLRSCPTGVLRLLAAALVLTLGARYAAAADEGWLVSFEKAKEQAAKEGKDILMEFTGSDWCPPCKALHKNVLTTEVFQTEVPKQFILLKLDNPRDKSHQSKEEQAQYQELASRFNVQGVPTVMLADASGTPYARKVGYGGTPAEQYVEQLKEATGTKEKRDELLAQAEQASGLEKAKLLDQALETVGDLALVAYDDVAEKIVDLDAENEAGLKEKYQGKLRQQKIEQALADINQTVRTSGPEAALGKIESVIDQLDPQGETLQQILVMKAQMFFSTDKAKSRATLEAAKKVAPESEMSERIDAILERFFSDKSDSEADKKDGGNE